MRLVLAITLLAASAVSAHAAEDRYGPAHTATPGVAAPTPYAGTLLGWSGKSPPAAPAAAQPSAPVRPPLMAGGLYRSAPQTPMPPTPTPAGYRPAPAPAGYAPAPAPTSLSSRPVAQAPVDSLPPPPSPTAVQGGIYASSGARFYSVHRPYGVAPDPIPAVPAGERMAYRPEASLAGAVALSGVGDGVRNPDAESDDSMAGVGAADAQEDAERAARRDAERAAARRAAAPAGAGQ